MGVQQPDRSLNSPDLSPRLDAIAANNASGKLWLEVTNLDPENPVEIEADLVGIAIKSAAGETLTAPKVDSINTVEAPGTVVPKPVSANIQGGELAIKLEPKSVTIISIVP